MILDIFSRYVVGWMIAERESAALAEKLIEETYARQGIQPGELTLHADRGTSMRSKPVAFLLADLGVSGACVVADAQPMPSASVAALRLPLRIRSLKIPRAQR